MVDGFEGVGPCQPLKGKILCYTVLNHTDNEDLDAVGRLE